MNQFAAPRIRKARPEDVPGLVRLWREMWDLHAASDPRFRLAPDGEKAMDAWIRQHVESPTSCVLVAEVWEGAPSPDRVGLAGRGAEAPPTSKPAPLGYILGMVLENPPVTPDRYFGLVSEIAVRADRRRAGIGGKLLAELMEWFRILRVAYVETNVAVLNPVARAFWRKQGFGEFLERLRIEMGPR